MFYSVKRKAQSCVVKYLHDRLIGERYLRRYATLGKLAVKARKALLQDIVQDQRLGRKSVGRVACNGVPEM